MNQFDPNQAATIGSVLIVDDDPAIIRLVDQLIDSHYGKSVLRFHASNAVAAEEVIRGELIDVVITDLYMGEIDGIRLVNWLKNWEPLIQVLVITGNETPDALRESCAAGASDFFVKPFSRFELIKSVDFMLSRIKRWEPLLVPVNN